MPWPTAHGPDIAHYQIVTGEPVDPGWRLCSHKCSEGANSGDMTFPSRWRWMRDQGFPYRGAYHWLRSDSPVGAQAANVIRRIDLTGGLWRGEFIQSDWETTPGITVNTAEDEREFCDRLEQHYGRACTITYSSDWIPDSANDSDLIGEFYEWLSLTQGNAPLWYANYNSDPSNKFGGQQECARYGADVWQFTSSFKHPSIVSQSGGGFDMNHVLNWATLDRIAGYAISEHPEQPAPAPPPAVTPSSSTEEEDSMRIKTPGQWFEKVGVDLRAIANGTEFAGLPGAEVSLTLVEMAQLLDTCRYTYGEAKPEMSAAFVSTWNAHREPVAAGSVGEIVFPPFRLTGVITPG